MSAFVKCPGQDMIKCLLLSSVRMADQSKCLALFFVFCTSAVS